MPIIFLLLIVTTHRLPRRSSNIQFGKKNVRDRFTKVFFVLNMTSFFLELSTETKLSEK